MPHSSFAACDPVRFRQEANPARPGASKKFVSGKGPRPLGDALQNRQVSQIAAPGLEIRVRRPTLEPQLPSAFLFDTAFVGNPHPAGLRLSGAFTPDESQKKA